MLIVPVQVAPDAYNVFLVLQDQGLERIRQYDPAELSIEKMPQPWRSMRLKSVWVGYATSEEAENLTACNDQEALEKALKNLSRGFKFCPEKGDTDLPYRKGRN